MFRRLAILAVVATTCVALPAQAQLTALTEGFETAPPVGWTVQNNSSPLGAIGYFQGNPGAFPAQAGATNSYVGVNYQSTTGANTISNFLITPHLDFSNAGTFSFYTRTSSTVNFPDRLQVLLSNSGTSTNVGTANTDVGDFTTTLLDINPNYTLTDYPNAWTQYNLAIPAGANGRIAFRYFVENGGPLGDNSDYIGIDTVVFSSAVPEPGLLTFAGAIGLGVFGRRRML